MPSKNGQLVPEPSTFRPRASIFDPWPAVQRTHARMPFDHVSRRVRGVLEGGNRRVGHSKLKYGFFRFGGTSSTSSLTACTHRSRGRVGSLAATMAKSLAHSAC